MNLEEKDINQVKQEIIDKLEKADNKVTAMIEAFEMYSEAKHADLIQQLKNEAAQVEEDKEYAKALSLRTLSKKEKEFYNKVIINPEQSINGNQIDIIPNTIVDLTLADVRTESDLLSHIKFAPGDVKKWYTASKNGAFAWTTLKAAIERNKDLAVTFNTIITELGKLYVLIIIPKSIRELSLPFVDKYFRAVLKEQLNDGLIFGLLLGDGKEQPIGLYKKIDEVGSDKANVDKEVNDDLVSFTPKGLSKVKKYLTKGGIRKADELILICNPADAADYVDPCIYDAEGKLVSSHKKLTVIEEPMNPKGKAALYLSKTYTLSCSKAEITEYNQTLALEDADVIIGKAYANGRAIDDNCAYIFDVTKLQEYVPAVRVVNMPEQVSSSNTPEIPEA